MSSNIMAMLSGAGLGKFVGVATATPAGATSHVCNKPAGTVAGDILVAIMGGSNTGAAITWTGGTGFTEPADQGASPNLRVAYLVAGASEPATYTFTSSAATNSSVHILRFSNGLFDAAGSIVATAADGALAATGITSAGGCVIASFLSRLGASTHSTPSGMTLVAQTNAGGNQMLSTFAQQVPAGATGTRTCTIGGGVSDANAGIVVGIK